MNNTETTDTPIQFPPPPIQWTPLSQPADGNTEAHAAVLETLRTVGDQTAEIVELLRATAEQHNMPEINPDLRRLQAEDVIVDFKINVLDRTGVIACVSGSNSLPQLLNENSFGIAAQTLTKTLEQIVKAVITKFNTHVLTILPPGHRPPASGMSAQRGPEVPTLGMSPMGPPFNQS